MACSQVASDKVEKIRSLGLYQLTHFQDIFLEYGNAFLASLRDIGLVSALVIVNLSNYIYHSTWHNVPSCR